MAATITVFIQGLAICYPKRVGREDVWRVFFLIDDDCHRVEFSHQKTPGRTTVHGELGKPNGRYEIIADSDKPIDSTERFKNEVFNLTVPGETHGKLEKKHGAEQVGTLLTIHHIELGVDKNLRLCPREGEGPLELFLTYKKAKKKKFAKVAYSIKGTIHLREGGKIKVMEEGVTQPIFESSESCTLFFDNDCLRDVGDEGDLEKLYCLIKDEDSDDPDERFLVESRKSESGEANPPCTGARTGDSLTFDGDKPCLIAQADKNRTQNLP